MQNIWKNSNGNKNKQLCKLQKTIADSSNSLLSLEEQILSLIDAYKEQKDIQISLRFVTKQAQSLRQRLTDCQTQLAAIDTSSLSSTVQDSLSVSQQLLAQNLLILSNQEATLQQFSEHRKVIHANLHLNQDLTNQIQIQEFKQQLQTYRKT